MPVVQLGDIIRKITPPANADLTIRVQNPDSLMLAQILVDRGDWIIIVAERYGVVESGN